MKVNLQGLFANIVSDTPARRKAYNAGCLEEVYNHIRDVLDGKHTIEEFAEHYCIEKRPAKAKA